MDPLSALAIVAAVVQFADVGQRLVTSWLTRQKEQQGPSVGELKAELGFLIEAIRGVYQDADLQMGRMMHEGVLERCATLMKRLEELEDAQPPKGPSLRDRFDRTTYGKLPERRALEDIEAHLYNLKTSVITVLATSIWYMLTRYYPPLTSSSLAHTRTGSIQKTARDGSLTLPTS